MGRQVIKGSKSQSSQTITRRCRSYCYRVAHGKVRSHACLWSNSAEPTWREETDLSGGTGQHVSSWWAHVNTRKYGHKRPCSSCTDTHTEQESDAHRQFPSRSSRGSSSTMVLPQSSGGSRIKTYKCFQQVFKEEKTQTSSIISCLLLSLIFFGLIFHT